MRPRYLGSAFAGLLVLVSLALAGAAIHPATGPGPSAAAARGLPSPSASALGATLAGAGAGRATALGTRARVESGPSAAPGDGPTAGATDGATGGISLAAVTARSPDAVRKLAGFDLAEARIGDEIVVVLWPGDAAPGFQSATRAVRVDRGQALDLGRIALEPLG